MSREHQKTGSVGQYSLLVTIIWKQTMEQLACLPGGVILRGMLREAFLFFFLSPERIRDFYR